MGSRSDLAARIHAAAHLVGEFKLRSGVTSSEYFDKYAFESDPALLGEIAAAMTALVPPEADALAGLELGGVPLAVAISARLRIPALFVRKHAKQYGTCRQIEGGELAGRKVVVIEDVVTSGGAIFDGLRALREGGASVLAVVCAIDRGGIAGSKLAAEGVPFEAAFTIDELNAAADQATSQPK